MKAIHETMEDDSYLREAFDAMTVACGQCWQSSNLHPDVDDENLEGMAKDINDICMNYTEFKGNI